MSGDLTGLCLYMMHWDLPQVMTARQFKIKYLCLILRFDIFSRKKKIFNFVSDTKSSEEIIDPYTMKYCFYLDSTACHQITKKKF